MKIDVSGVQARAKTQPSLLPEGQIMAIHDLADSGHTGFAISSRSFSLILAAECSGLNAQVKTGWTNPEGYLPFIGAKIVGFSPTDDDLHGKTKEGTAYLNIETDRGTLQFFASKYAEVPQPVCVFMEIQARVLQTVI